MVTDNLGLNQDEAEKRLIQYGSNQIFKKTSINFWSIAAEEITEPMILLLLTVGFFYSIWGKLEDAITIFVVILVLVFTEVYNEFRAKKAINSLDKIAAPKTRVKRNGRIEEIDSELIVPGDILILTAGSKIAADAKIINSINLQVDESLLTGESFPLAKNNEEKIFAGTTVVGGEAEAEVTKTGGKTRFGQTAVALQEIKPKKTALQMAMKKLAGRLVYVAIFVSVLIPVIGLIRGQDLKTMILTGLALSFVVIPEELPMVITMVLGLGSYNLSKHNFLVKKIKAAEILGNATVIVTDKTGTVTTGKMEIVSTFPKNNKNVIQKALSSVFKFSVSPLDLGIIKKAEELKIKKGETEILRQKDLDNKEKTKSIIIKTGKEMEIICSGAPEKILAMCKKISAETKKELEKETEKGRRVIAIAFKKINNKEKDLIFAKLEKNLQFAGLISFADNPREGVKETIKKALDAGIRTIMVTGDHPKTAEFVAQEIGILNIGGKAILGSEIDKMSDDQLKETLKYFSVFARTSPEHKYRIVKNLQEMGEIVAVTGDGINDSLALKGADIGIAMGIKGTDVAKEAADIILADDNYITITRGIFEGRKLFDNLQKGIKYYLAVKLALIFIFLLPVLIGIPLPLAPIQIIVSEVFMDLAASAGYVAEPEEKNIYLRKPDKNKGNVLDNMAIKDIFIKGIILFVTVIAVYFYARFLNLNFLQTQTFAFSAWIFAHIFLAFSSRSDRETIWSLGIFKNIIINIWAVMAIGLLLLGIYWPIVTSQLNLSFINPLYLLLIIIFCLIMTSILEIKKTWQK
jgi:P-type Ca2+ transporter type 2C